MDSTRAHSERHGLSSDVTRVLFAALMGAVAGALGVWFLTRGELSAAREAYDDTRTLLVRARADLALLSAHRAVDDAAEYLEQDNYGLMMASLDRARLALSSVGAEATDPATATVIDALEADLAVARLQTHWDVDAQRARLADIEARIESVEERLSQPTTQ